KDLAENDQTPVTLDQGNKMAIDTSAAHFIECSALKRDGVQEVFEAAVRAAIARRKKKGGCCTVL
uniref:hypothetical protein n=2 Tax=unclassified Salmonella TaxID=2614656 RepID=UPI003754CC79